MRLFVTVKTRKKEEQVVEEDETHFVVSVKAIPEDGKANKAAAGALARHLGIAPSCLTLSFGNKSKQKIFERESV